MDALDYYDSSFEEAADACLHVVSATGNGECTSMVFEDGSCLVYSHECDSFIAAY